MLCGDISHIWAVNSYADSIIIIQACFLLLNIPYLTLVTTRWDRPSPKIFGPRNFQIVQFFDDFVSKASAFLVGQNSEQVQPLRDRSLLWHNMWVDCGRPWSGVVFDCMS